MKLGNQPEIPQYDQKVEYNTDGTQKYVGYCFPGVAESTTAWSLFKMDYDGSKRFIARRYASGTDNFIHSWTLRDGYSYTDI